MIAHPPSGNSSFRLVAKGLAALHQMGKDGKDDSPEADSIRDALDAPWGALNKKEEERLQWLSEDLYSVSEPPAEAVQKEMNPQVQQQLNEAIEARRNREWDRALALLRRCSEYISPALLSYLRGSIWLEAGCPEAAVMFYEHASKSDPANTEYRTAYRRALAESVLDAAHELPASTR
jgi:hypothetical protein